MNKDNHCEIPDLRIIREGNHYIFRWENELGLNGVFSTCSSFEAAIEATKEIKEQYHLANIVFETEDGKIYF